jgi:hypothetical protein
VGAFFMGELRLFMGELRFSMGDYAFSWGNYAFGRKQKCVAYTFGQEAGVFRPKLDLGAKKMTQVD